MALDGLSTHLPASTATRLPVYHLKPWIIDGAALFSHSASMQPSFPDSSSAVLNSPKPLICFRSQCLAVAVSSGRSGRLPGIHYAPKT